LYAGAVICLGDLIFAGNPNDEWLSKHHVKSSTFPPL
jgi:hypothetical protein